MEGQVKLRDIFEDYKTKENKEKLEQNPCSRRDHISLSYLTNLSGLVGSERAIDIVKSCTLDDLLRGEDILDQFKFADLNETPVEKKIDNILKILNWEKALGNLTDRGYYLENITDTFAGFEHLNDKLITTKNKEVKDWFFFRDVLCGVTRNLLSNYGTPLTSENKSSGHIGQATRCAEKLVLPNLSTDKLLDFLISKQIEGKSVDEYSIVKGFDNCVTAMEVASKNYGRNYGETAERYIKFGFTSLEKINEINAEDLKIVEEAFELGDNNPGTTKKFKALVPHQINGNKKQLEKFLKLTDKPQPGRYLYAFNSINNLTKFFSEVEDEKRPSPESILYSRKIFKTKEFEQTIKIAKQIDSPLIKEDIWSFSYIESGEVKYKDLDELTKLTIEYRKSNEQYKELTKNKEDLNKKGYERIKEFGGDLRFLRYTNISLNNCYTSGFEDIKNVTKLMTFEEFEDICFNSENKLMIMGKLASIGYAKEDIQEAFSKKICNIKNLEKVLMKVDKTIPLKFITFIANTNIDESYGLSMIETSLFKEQKVPYGLLPSLYAYKISPEQLDNFADVISIDEYKSANKFDAIRFIENITDFYNKTK